MKKKYFLKPPEKVTLTEKTEKSFLYLIIYEMISYYKYD